MIISISNGFQWVFINFSSSLLNQGDDFTRSYDDHLNNGFADAEELVRDFSCYQARVDVQHAKFWFHKEQALLRTIVIQEKQVQNVVVFFLSAAFCQMSFKTPEVFGSAGLFLANTMYMCTYL